MTETLRPRPRVLPSSTAVLATSHGDLYLTVAIDGDGGPFEVFGRIGKSGTFEQGVTELACRLISLHLRRGTSVEDVVDQCRGVGGMEPPAQPASRRQVGVRTGPGRRHRPHPAGLREGRPSPGKETRPARPVRPSVAEHDAEFVRVA